MLTYILKVRFESRPRFRDCFCQNVCVFVWFCRINLKYFVFKWDIGRSCWTSNSGSWKSSIFFPLCRVSGCTDYFAQDEKSAFEICRNIVSTLNVHCEDDMQRLYARPPLYDPAELPSLIPSKEQHMLDMYQVSRCCGCEIVVFFFLRLSWSSSWDQHLLFLEVVVFFFTTVWCLLYA